MQEQIQEILDLIKPFLLKDVIFKDEDITKLAALGFNKLKKVATTPTIVEFKYKNLNCSFRKDYGCYTFESDVVLIQILEDYDNEHKAQVFVNKSSFLLESFNVKTPFKTNCKITVYNN